MESSNIIALGSFLLAAVALFISIGSKRTADKANDIANYDRILTVARAVSQTAKIASNQIVNKEVYNYFIKHTLLARQVGFSESSLLYIDLFKTKLERLKLIYALAETDLSEAVKEEKNQLQNWFFEQQLGSIGKFDKELSIN
ncbi:MAG: hypothetical protein SWH78_17680 [Thermodesulfobacteriota bacterium]|nr:hypothetical protein [Thermodesulfobacteriota bacterium]